MIRNCDSPCRNSDSEISRKAKRSGKIRKIATFAQQFALINSVFLVISNFSIHKVLEVAHVYVVRADSNSRGRLNLWLKQLRRHLRRERNPPRRRPPRRQFASRRRKRQRGELPNWFTTPEFWTGHPDLGTYQSKVVRRSQAPIFFKWPATAIRVPAISFC